MVLSASEYLYCAISTAACTLSSSCVKRGSTACAPLGEHRHTESQTGVALKCWSTDSQFATWAATALVCAWCSTLRQSTLQKQSGG